MKRIFYFNVNYQCNQSCIFCFSHNTCIDKTKSEISIGKFERILSDYKIGQADRIVINGGEPTLHHHLTDILSASVSTHAEVVMYSNGLLFSDFSFAKKIINTGLNRITIPFHGTETVHNFITQNKNSFSLLLQATKNITSISHNKIIEPKFIITEKMANENFKILDFMDFNDLLSSSASVIITGQINTEIAKKNNFICRTNSHYTTYVENQIEAVLGRVPLKIFDFRLCEFSDALKDSLLALPDHSSRTRWQYFFCDYNHVPVIMEYNSMRNDIKCLCCKLRKYCRSILDSYLVLSVSGNIKKNIWE